MHDENISCITKNEAKHLSQVPDRDGQAWCGYVAVMAGLFPCQRQEFSTKNEVI